MPSVASHLPACSGMQGEQGCDVWGGGIPTQDQTLGGWDDLFARLVSNLVNQVSGVLGPPTRPPPSSPIQALG